jgi:hypothetical protein
MSINKGVGKLITVMISVVFVVHFIACGWYWLADFNDLEPNCWVARQGLLHASITYKYTSAVYWAFATLTTVGYGDINALTILEKVIAILWMIFGFGFYSYTIGNLQTIINEIDQRSHHLQIKLDTLLEFSKRTGLPNNLQKDITRFINNNSFTEDCIPP